MKNKKPLLIGLLGFTGGITLINVIIMYWFPIIFPFTVFTPLRLVMLAYIKEQYWLVLVSVLVCILLLMTIREICKQRILFPILSLLYLVYDFLTVLYVLIDSISDGYWTIYIVQILMPLILIILICIYCWTYFAAHRVEDSSGTGDGSRPLKKS